MAVYVVLMVVGDQAFLVFLHNASGRQQPDMAFQGFPIVQ